MPPNHNNVEIEDVMPSYGCPVKMAQCLLKKRNFFCREWTFSKINHCLENRPTSKTCGALIVGGPGCGKSAVCAELTWPTVSQGKQCLLNQRLIAWHFCQAHDIESLSITSFILNLVNQLSESKQINGYLDIINDPEVQRLLNPVEIEKNPDLVFQQAVLEPLQMLEKPERTVFMIVDSIDECYLQSLGEKNGESRTIAELLANHHHNFPPWLLLVCSARKQSKTVTRMFTGFRKISLDDLRKSHVVRDVQQYILCRLDKEERLRQHLSRDTAEMLNQLHIKSNGCFLYLERVLDGVSENFIMLREIREIPGTLNGLYLWLCQRIFGRKQFTKIQPIINVILASNKPVNSKDLFDCVHIKNTDLTGDKFSKQIESMKKILIEGQNGSKILFHHSFAEWLLDVKHCTQKYLCNASEGHAMLAMRATMSADKLKPLEVQEMALHMLRGNFYDVLQYTNLVQWLMISGADIETSLSVGIPKEQKVTKLLLDAGAKLPSDPDEAETASMHASMIEEVDNEKQPTLDVSVNQVDSNGRTVLHNAAHEGNIQLLTTAIANSADLEAVDKKGQTALILSSRQGHAEIVAILLASKVCVDRTDDDGWTALRSAAWGGHNAVVLLLLGAGAGVDHADTDKRTALRAAAWGGHEEIVIQLLEHQAEVNKADNDGRTALIAAAYMGHAEIVQDLLKNNADVNQEDRDGRTALSVAAVCIRTSEGHEKVVGLLLENGAEVNHQDHDGMTPLLVAACEGHQEVCELLLEWDADIDHADNNGRTPLLAAASMGHSKIVNQLLVWGCAVDTIDSEGRIVLSIAAAQGNVNVVQQLLERGLDEMHRDNAGWSPLHMAAYEGHLEVCNCLIEHCAKVNEVDNDGRHPLILAAQEGHLEVVTSLVENGSTIDHRSHDQKTAFRVAALESHRKVVEYLYEQGANINYKDADGRSTVYMLSLENKVDILQYLLEIGADVESTDLEGRTALHISAWQGHFEIVSLLLKFGAKVNAVDNDNRTSLQSAAWQGHEKVVKLLLENGANVDHTCNQGATALCIAAQEGHEHCVRVLLQYHANPNHADQFGRTPIKVAMKSGHSGICKLLEENGATPMTKSRSNSSTSSNETRPTSTAGSAHTHATVTTGVIVNGNQLNSSPSESPDSTFDRRKSFASNNSSKSSSNMTSSTSQSNQSAPNSNECLTFTQQLQQCSMARHRARPVSRILSPVSEPQSPVQSPNITPSIEVMVHNEHNKLSPITERNLNILAKSPVKFSNMKDKEISATINIITNPNADFSDEPVWQINPQHFISMKNDLEKLKLHQKTNTEQSNVIMGQSALEMRSPEMRRKRNGIVTNPKITKSGAMNGHFNKISNLTGEERIMNGHGPMSISVGPGSNYSGPPRPNGLPLKKETPL
ncbi:uncharacterized protein LOC143085486 isoform X2 [Mytilus galloprovincialis]